jgi:hypothetical protein
LDISDFYHERFGRVRGHLPSDLPKEYRLREWVLEEQGAFHTFPVWDGYLQYFGKLRSTTPSNDGKTHHNWYSLRDFKLGWFYDGKELFVFVLREKGMVYKYQLKMQPPR